MDFILGTLKLILSIFLDEHFTDVERKWIERLQWFIEVYIKMFIITGIVYITSPNIFAAIQYAMDKPNASLFPETAKIECDSKGFLDRNQNSN